MLSIQPKFTQYATAKQTAFGMRNPQETPEDRYFENKTNYYKEQTQAFDEALLNEHTPDVMKKVIKGFKVVSEGLLEGWAVAWGASKGLKIIKGTTIKGLNSKFAKHAEDILKPVGEGLKNAGRTIKTKFGNLIDKFKASNFATKTAEKFTSATAAMRNNAVGKYVVMTFEGIGKGFNYIGGLIKKGANKVITPLKEMSAGEIYDKAAKATSTTFGVGAGAAGAYNATMKPEDKNKIKDEVDERGYDDENSFKGTGDHVDDDFDNNFLDEQLVDEPIEKEYREAV